MRGPVLPFAAKHPTNLRTAYLAAGPTMNYGAVAEVLSIHGTDHVWG
jgi:hypothetical protein